MNINMEKEMVNIKNIKHLDLEKVADKVVERQIKEISKALKKDVKHLNFI